MNGITHKEAIRLINRRLDGLVNKSQSLALVEHLQSCDSCRAYASEMDGLPARLQNEFRARWDKNPGPSQRVTEQVTRKARRIPMANRFSAGLKLFAGLATLLAAVFLINFVVSQLRSTSIATTGKQNTNLLPRAEDRLLAFASDQNGNSDIYTIHPDGSDLLDLTNNPAQDSSPFWSPDGKRIAFLSDRDGSTQIYLMDADGSNVIQLTHGGDHTYEFDLNGFRPASADGFTPWSPDSRKLIFASVSPAEKDNQLYVIDIAEENLIALTNEAGMYASPSWSPDGSHIAFVSYQIQGTVMSARIFVVDKHGDNLTEITKVLPENEIPSWHYRWSEDGKFVFFVTDTQTSKSTIYKAGLNGSLAPSTTVDWLIMDWWDETTVQLEPKGSSLRWLKSDGSESTLEPCQNADLRTIVTKRSDTGNLVFALNCSGSGWMLYWANPDGTLTNKLLSLSIPGNYDSILHPTWLTWAPDDQFLAFAALDDTTSANPTDTLYILNVAQARENPSVQPLKIANSSSPSWQPILSNDIVKEKPTPEPTQVVESIQLPSIGTNVSNGEWLALIAGDYNFPGEPKLDVYMVRPEGSGLVNITNSTAHYYGLQWSPNGQQLTFIKKNADNKFDILRKDTETHIPSLLTSVAMKPDEYLQYNWSPNSDQVLFSGFKNGNYDLYSIYADGRNDPQLKQLTNDSGQDVGFTWAPDGSQIAFQRLNGEKLSVYIMNEDGSNQREVAHGAGKVNLKWSYDGTSIWASSTENSWLECEGCINRPAIYRIQLNEPSVHQVYYEEDLSKVDAWYLYDTSQDELYFMRIKHQDFLELWGTWFRADGNSVTEIGEMDPHQACKAILSESISPNARFSVVSNYCGSFDLYLADREASSPQQRFIHLLSLPSSTEGQGGDNATVPIGWSPDGRWLIYDNGRGSWYLLDIEKAIQNPGAALSPLIQPETFADQQFQSPESVQLFDLVWQPAP